MNEDERRPARTQTYGWSWTSEPERSPGIPWLGLFLVVFGALLLLEQVLPQFRFAGSAFLLAIALTFLIRWALRRGTASLYAGAIIAGLALPGVLQGLGVAGGPGLGTFCLGLAFLFIAAVRFVGSGGVGWQAWVGVILTAIGGAQVIEPAVRGLLLPALVVALGGVLVLRGLGRR